jgi:hypothetical protein
VTDEPPTHTRRRRRNRTRTVPTDPYAAGRTPRPQRQPSRPAAYGDQEDRILQALQARPGALAADLPIDGLNARQVGIYLGRLYTRRLVTRDRDGTRHRWTAL